VLLVVLLDTQTGGHAITNRQQQQHCGYQEDIDDLKQQIDILKKIIDETPAVATPSSSSSSTISSRQKQRSLAQVSSFTHASDFGVVGDAQTDDTSALQDAIDSAANDDSGGTVILPKGVFLTTSSLVIPGGITVRGQGYGSSPLQIKYDAGGSTIAYCGTDYAVKLAGHGASLQDAAVYDWRYPVGSHCDQIKAAGGVLVDADNNNLVESVTMNNVLIYYFMGGAALTLKANNESGIAYNNFQNIRIRHARIGISLQADETSFVNSNSFIAGAISGGITDAGIYAQGPGDCNDNKFIAMVIEPSHTNLAHVYVTGKGTNIHLLETRLEGTNMFDLQKPLVIIDDTSYGNIITGMLGHTHVQADFNRNPGIDMMSAKSVGLDPAPLNQFWNSAFKGIVYEDNNDIGNLPGWKVGQTNRKFTIAPIEERLYAEHNVLNIDYLNWGGSFKLEPDRLLASPGHSFATFGIYAKTNISGAISAAMRYTSGNIISSASHSGSGEWEFIGMSALYDIDAPKFYFSITDDVQVTAPHFAYGQTPPTPGASLISSSGAQMAGTLSLGMATVGPPASGNYWLLPKNEGNIFIMDMKGDPNRDIHRINYRTADRFPRGSVITLIFPEAGTTVVNGGYIKLRGEQRFTSTVNSALTLLGSGSASWTEISRNE